MPPPPISRRSAGPQTLSEGTWPSSWHCRGGLRLSGRNPWKRVDGGGRPRCPPAAARQQSGPVLGGAGCAMCRPRPGLERLGPRHDGGGRGGSRCRAVPQGRARCPRRSQPGNPVPSSSSGNPCPVLCAPGPPSLLGSGSGTLLPRPLPLPTGLPAPPPPSPRALRVPCVPLAEGTGVPAASPMGLSCSAERWEAQVGAVPRREWEGVPMAAALAAGPAPLSLEGRMEAAPGGPLPSPGPSGRGARPSDQAGARPLPGPGNVPVALAAPSQGR